MKSLENTQKNHPDRSKMMKLASNLKKYDSVGYVFHKQFKQFSSLCLEKCIDKKMWPVRSLDLNSVYFLETILSEYIKAIVDFKANIEKEIKNIDQTILKSTYF